MALRRIPRGLILPTYNSQCCSYQRKLKNFPQHYYISTRNIFRCNLMRGIEIVSDEDLKIKKRGGKLPLIEGRQKNKPLLLLFTWMGCTPKQADKFVHLYLNKGFDVLLVSFLTSEVIRWWEGTERKAGYLIDFLRQNEAYEPIVYHGFSVGNGLWTSMLWQMSQKEEEYGPTVDRIKGQIWDSVSQTSNVVRNVCYATFPTNKTMGQLFYKLIRLSLQVTGPGIVDGINAIYERNNVIFNNPPFKKPSLLFCSKGDIYSELEGVLKAYENWKAIGMQAHVKYWEKSTHVGHFFLHREEYVEALDSFLKSIGVEKQGLEEVIAPYEIPQIQKIKTPIIRQ